VRFFEKQIYYNDIFLVFVMMISFIMTRVSLISWVTSC